MKFILKLIEVANIFIKSTLSYIAGAWGAFIATVIQIFVFYYIWMTIYGGEMLLKGISKHQMIAYIILSRVLYTQFIWSYIHTIGEKIHSGEIAIDLLRPLDFQLFMYVGRLGDSFAFAAITAVPALIIAVFSLGFYLPVHPITYIYFSISLLMALTIAFFIEFMISLIAFYTNYSWGLQTLHEALLSLFSGALIPLVFFPGWLRAIIDALPFKDMMYTPISIYLELVKGHQIAESMLFQMIWIVVLLILSRLFFAVSIKKITVQGG